MVNVLDVHNLCSLYLPLKNVVYVNHMWSVHTIEGFRSRSNITQKKLNVVSLSISMIVPVLDVQVLYNTCCSKWINYGDAWHFDMDIDQVDIHKL